MRTVAKAVVGLLLCSGAAATASAQSISLDQLCPINADGARRFSPSSLMTAVLDATKPSRRAIDANGDGTETEVERIAAIVDNPCSVGKRCPSDNQSIVSAQGLLLDVFARDDVTVARRRPPPTAAERRIEPWLAAPADPDSVGSIAELLDPRGRFLSLTCVAPATPADTIATSGDIGPPPPPRERPTVRVTSKLEELTRAPEQDVKTIDAATLSIANNGVDDKLTFAIDGIIGLNIPMGPRSSLIPFVQYQRTSVRDRSVTPANTKRSPDKLGLGAVVSLRVAPHDQVDAAPVYLVDYEHGSRLISAKINWIPGFLRTIDGLPVLRARRLVPDLLYWGITPRVLIQGSHVFDAGTNPELFQTSDYLRMGSDISLDIWGAGPLSGLTAGVAYKRLFRFTSGPRDIDLLKVNLQFWLDQSEHVSLGYVYERGLDEDTANRVENWRLALGVRF
jgi:hypothetical protein